MVDILLYTRTADYRHDSIPHAVATLSAVPGFAVRLTEDPTRSRRPSAGGPARSSSSRPAATSSPPPGGSGSRRTSTGAAASPACTRRPHRVHGWPYYGELLAARFDRHPAYQPGRLTVTDRDHPATRHLGDAWEFTDEWYDFRSDPRASDPATRVLARADESSYEGAATSGGRPLAWCRAQGAGRVFYTALGHAASATTTRTSGHI